MDDEKTLFDGEKRQYQSHDEEATQYDDAYNKENKKSGTSDSKNRATIGKKSVWKIVAVGTGSGLLLGSSATLLSAPVDHIDGGNVVVGEEEENETHPEWTDGEISVATSVNDDMSFSEAFAAARTEVGSGGAFEWRGNIYGTFTADEWNGMTAEQKEEYGSHFSWNKVNSSTETASSSHSSTTSQTADTSDEVEVVTTENSGPTNQSHEVTNDEVEVAEITQTGTAEDGATVEVDPEVEVLGFVHDEESGANIGGMLVDGQEVVLVDVDGDEIIDVMGVDYNGDHQITQDEFVDISGQHISVNDFGGVSNPNNPLYASNDNETDYTNDAEYGGA